MQMYELKVAVEPGFEYEESELRTAVENIAKNLGVLFEHISICFIPIIQQFGEALQECEEEIERMFSNVKQAKERVQEHEYFRELHKLDFTRKKTVHQVTCRKPKHLVKKIIR